jgi:phage tail protein X
VGIIENEPLTEVGVLTVLTQVPAPLQAPVQPANSEPLAGEAVKVTGVPLAKIALQVLGQLMPDGLLVTVPDPPPLSERVRAELGTEIKLAWIEVAAATVTTQVPVPLQSAPVQAANSEPPAGEAVKVTWVPSAKTAVQALGQLMPEGLLVTVPDPPPVGARVRAELGTAEKVAETEVAAFTVTKQVPVPLQPPPVQPAKVKPFPVAAVSVTWVFGVNWVLQVVPQLIPDGELVTVPVPERATDTI